MATAQTVRQVTDPELPEVPRVSLGVPVPKPFVHAGLVSVIVLTRNRPGKLRMCIDSLLAQQVTGEMEILLVDDGSDEAHGPAVGGLAASDPRVQLLRQSHRGIPAARNHGVARARGEFIAIVADDYVLHENYLREGLAYLRKNPEAAVVRFRMAPLNDDLGSRVSHRYYDASIAYRLDLDHGRRPPVWRGPASCPLPSGPTERLEASGAAIFRSKVFETVGPFDESLQRGEDTEFTARLRRAGLQVHFVDQVLVAHQYERWPTDTLRKCLLTGFWREQLLQANEVAGASRWRSLAQKLFGVRHAIRRAGHGSGWLHFLLCLPWMLVFEAATLTGHAAAWITAGFGRAPGPPPSDRTEARSSARTRDRVEPGAS